LALGDRAKRCLSEDRARAEDALKLSDDEIEESFTSSATVCRALFDALRSPVGFCPIEPPIQFHKRSQLFIRTHNETLSVVAMRVSNPDCSPVGIHG